MDARPTPEQRELESAANRLAQRLGVRVVADLDDLDRRTRLDAAITQAGWRELRTGSTDEPLASGVEVALVARVLARHACDAPFVGPVLAHDLLRRAGIDDDTARTVAVASDLCGIAHGDGVAIDAAGSVEAVGLAADSSTIVRMSIGARADGGAGVDLTRLMVPVDRPTGLGSTLDAEPLLAWEALATVITAADLVGAAEGALDLATDYAKQRRQFGAPIGSFQAVQHLLAEAKTLTDGALSAMTYGAWAVDALPATDARAAAAVAKAYAARTARIVCETTIQVHGGIGNTWESMAHVFLRRALVSAELFGNDGHQLSLLAEQRWGAVHGLR